ncbi:septum formation inhibitor Maf [uncultured Kriegella sp.]|uniref:septum formation inhibitor Maf n=1 Tax=uncultured Kriegella sp. TaxID=1798910 RepID=UPI0030D79156|tara:strand:- start:39011 stop:39955 length:945 start_codon:yes stop_codon:yes gene_type:complete
MKKYIKFDYLTLWTVLFSILVNSCSEEKKSNTALLTEASSTANPKKELSDEFKKYWYAGDAEITSYRLEQARYGEMREGTSVLIFVTEPFLAKKQVKADEHHADNIPVLKLNSTKKYLTGIYPYSIMSSSFYPVHDNQHALKVSFSAQEWCGQVYAQLNNRNKFEIISHSYFASDADQEFEMDKEILEDELWNKIRVNPNNLPVGTIQIIPSMEYIRLSHKELKAYKATATLTKENEFKTYQISYPELDRTLKIKFSNAFPYIIDSWSETFNSDFDNKAKTMMSSKATKMKTLKTPYWQKNGNNHLSLRDSLGL